MRDRAVDSVKGFLAEQWPSFPSITADMWSSHNGDQYICISVHVCTATFDQRRVSLGALYFPPPHTSERIADILLERLTEFGMPANTTFTVTTD